MHRLVIACWLLAAALLLATWLFGKAGAAAALGGAAGAWSLSVVQRFFGEQD